MPRMVYNRMKKGVIEVEIFLQVYSDRFESISSTTDQKIVAALRQLSLEVSADCLVEMLRISEYLIHECRKRITSTIIKKKLETEHLRRARMAEAHLIISQHAKIEFSGSFGALHCSRWKLSCGSVR